MKLQTSIAVCLFLSLGVLCSAQNSIDPGDWHVSHTEALPYDIGEISLMLSRDQYLTASDSLYRLTELYPEDDALWFYLGQAQQRQGHFEAALQSFDTALALDPGNHFYYEAVLACYNILPNAIDKTDSLCAVMMERFPKLYRTPYMLTNLADNKLYREDSDSLARVYYEQALALDEDYTPAILGLAECNRMSGNMAAYFVNIDKFIRQPYIDPSKKSDYVGRIVFSTTAQERQIYFKQLCDMVDAVVDTHPADSSSLNLAGIWYYQAGDTEKAAEIYRIYEKACPENISPVYTLLFLYKNDVQAASEICDRALKRFSDKQIRCNLYSTKASILHDAGRKKEAYKCFDRAIKCQPDDATTLNNYAYVLFQDGVKIRKAEKMSRKAVELEPDNASFLDTYGCILYNLGKYEQARNYFKKCMVHGGKDHAECLYHYAITLQALGEKDLAAYYMQLYENKIKQ